MLSRPASPQTQPEDVNVSHFIYGNPSMDRNVERWKYQVNMETKSIYNIHKYPITHVSIFVVGLLSENTEKHASYIAKHQMCPSWSPEHTTWDTNWL